VKGSRISDLYAQNSYWQATNNTHKFYDCGMAFSDKKKAAAARENCCPEDAGCDKVPRPSDWTTDRQCAVGYSGPLCVACAENFLLFYQECIACDGGSPLWVGIAGLCGVGFVLFLVALVILNTTKPHSETLVETKQERISGLITIIVSWLQILSAFTVTYSVAWPKSFATFSQGSGTLVNLEIISVLAISNCQLSVPFLNKFLLQIATPPIFVAAVLAALAVITVSHGKQQGWQEVQTARKNAARQLIVLVIQLLYPKISTRTFQMFRCRDLGQGIGNLLEADFGKECFEGVHAQYVPYAVISAIVYLVGVPVGTFYALWSNRHKLHTQIVQARYGELYRHYDPKWFFWEVLLMINKCMLTGAMCAIAPGTPLQLLVAVIVCASYLLLVLHASPYRGILEDRLAFGTSLCLSFSLLLGLTIVMDSPQKPAFNSEWMGVILILVNVVPLILFLVFTLLVLKNGPNYGLMSAAEDVTQRHPQIVTDRVRVQPRLRHRLSAVDVQKVVVHDKVQRIENTSLNHRAAHVARIKEREAHADARVKARLAERAARKKSYVAKKKTENNNTSVVIPQSPAELIAGRTIQ
jgi:hypothetical protein